ncbi:hypothetical protein EDC04DRAFT_3093497 [Pisolithus marmoratus]|nr:hypothetical protein EDC04DRAFT_3093497 [Pisolithus marmoratus]
MNLPRRARVDSQRDTFRGCLDPLEVQLGRAERLALEGRARTFFGEGVREQRLNGWRGRTESAVEGELQESEDNSARRIIERNGGDPCTNMRRVRRTLGSFKYQTRTRLAFQPPPGKPLKVPPSTADRSTSSSPLSSETSMDPAIAAELALAVQLERLRVTEALAARDNVVVLLEDAYVSVRRKTATISRLERELEILRRSSSSPSGSNRRPLIQESQCGDSFAAAEDQTDVEKGLSVESHVRSDSPFSWVRIATPSKITGFLKRRAACTSRASDKVFPVVTDDLNEELRRISGQFGKNTEGFYNKDGKWYFAGTYVAFLMDDPTTQEWGTAFDRALIKETLADRKNVSPQNTYETGQLYAAGTLRASCVGLQCIGFNNKVYHSVLEQSRFLHWTRSTRWTTPTPPTGGHDGSSDDGKSSVN